MKYKYIFILTFLLSYNLSAQIYPKWIRTFEQSFSMFQVHEGTLDSLSNYYSVHNDVTSPSEKIYIKKIDSAGIEIYNKQMWPDSIIPDTGGFYQVMLYNGPNNTILALTCGSDLSILKHLDGNGNELMRYLYFNFTVGAFVTDDYKYYLMSTDTSHNVLITVIDFQGNTISQDTIDNTGGSFSWDPFKVDKFGDVFAFYGRSNNDNPIFRYHNHQLVDSFINTSNYSQVYFDDAGYRYLSSNSGTTKYDTTWNVIWTNSQCKSSELKFDLNGNLCLINRDELVGTPVEKYDSSGNLLWSYPLNQPGIISHGLGNINIDTHGHIVITGGKFDFPGSNSNDKIFIAHFSDSGHIDKYFEQYYPNTTAAFIIDPYININDELFYCGYSLDSFQYSCMSLHQMPNVRGKVFYDSNSNCVQDSSEALLEHINVSSNQSVLYNQTNANGEYYLHLPDGSYQIDCGIPTNWMQTCPVGANNITIFNGVSSGPTDFGLIVLPGINDLFIDFIQPMSIRANRDVYILLHYQNLGSTIIDGTVRFEFDPVFSYVSSSITPDTISPYSLSWNFINLIPGEEEYIRIVLHSGTVPTNTPYSNLASIFTTVGDLHPSNNVFTMEGQITGSIDPNEKYVLPKGTGITGDIAPADSLLCYQIVFQNTGNDTAFYVMVIDTLDKNLDPLTFMAGAISMPCTYTLDGNGVLKFLFDPCDLPDSTTDEPNSHGYINYFIETDNNLPIAIEIKNKADIYFDYNLPITTNTTINTIRNPVTIEDVLGAELFQLYPNPAQEKIILKIAKSAEIMSTVKLFSYDGKLIRKFDTKTNTYEIGLSGLSNGIYLIQIISDTMRQSKLFSKQ